MDIEDTVPDPLYCLKMCLRNVHEVVLENIGVEYFPEWMAYVAVLSLKDLPVGHGRQEVALVAPVTPLNVPIGHGVNPPSQVPIFSAEQ